jgi:hypothetical protein
MGAELAWMDMRSFIIREEEIQGALWVCFLAEAELCSLQTDTLECRKQAAATAMPPDGSNLWQKPVITSKVTGGIVLGLGIKTQMQSRSAFNL